MSRRAENSNTAPAVNPLAISIPEIVLFSFYFLAVWLIPVDWLDSAPGAVAFALASKVNPYLSEYSIAFASNPQYFIHCHVLATWIVAPFLYPLIIKRNGGSATFAVLRKKDIEKFGGLSIYIVLASIGFGVLYFGMLFLVYFPLVRGEWAIWIGGVSLSALMLSGILSLWVGTMYMAFYTYRFICKGDVK